jgi:predicted nucleotidyltransferase
MAAEVLPDLTQRITEAVQPLRVILFGSVARGEMGPHSDLDVLVVVADGVDQNQASKAIYRSLRGFGFPTDALVIGESDLVLHGQEPWLVYQRILAEGRELYRAEG